MDNQTTQRPVALITGGAGGIGKEICLALADTHELLVGGRNEEKVNKVVDQLPKAKPFICDLTDLAQIKKSVEKLDRLDVLVHCAGIAPAGKFSTISHDTWVEAFKINVVAIVDLTQACLPLLREAKGTLVALNSNSGLVAKPGNSVYSATKFALTAITDSLRDEERGTVRVVSIHPGRVDTSMQVELQKGKGKPYNPADHLRPQSVAQAVKMAVTATDEAILETIVIRPTTP